MNKVQLIIILVVLLFASCRKDCREKSYWLNIGLANNTEFEINISLFPKQEYLINEGMYRTNAVGGGGGHTEFTIESDSVYIWSFKYVIYTTNDTSIRPSDLLTSVFDSINIIVTDSVFTKVNLSPDTAINYFENPFENDSIWKHKLINSDTPNNFCENPGETKAYRFYIEQDMIINK